MQIIFAGKAHPADEPGKALIRQVHQLSQTPEFAGKIVFVEDYDMNVARYLVQGVDVWLNTPRRPNEASGTSGQKAALNGIPNLSVLDGWWAEGYNGSNGWAIGEARDYKSEAIQDEADASSLYNLLEDEIIPAFFDRDEDGIPTRWLASDEGIHPQLRAAVLDEPSGQGLHHAALFARGPQRPDHGC